MCINKRISKMIILSSHKHINTQHDLIVGQKRYLLHNGQIVIATIEHFDTFNVTVKLECGFKFKTLFNLIYKELPPSHSLECNHFSQEEVTS